MKPWASNRVGHVPLNYLLSECLPLSAESTWGRLRHSLDSSNPHGRKLFPQTPEPCVFHQSKSQNPPPCFVEASTTSPQHSLWHIPNLFWHRGFRDTAFFEDPT